MTDYLRSVLDELVPAFEDEPGDWERVRRDAKLGERASRAVRRRLILVTALVTAVAIPFAALAASQGWWFFSFGEDTPPITDVKVVRTGTWDGTAWTLHAYLSSTDGVCFGITPTASLTGTGTGGAQGCAQIEGVPRTPQSKPYAPLTITYLVSPEAVLPAHIVGPVVDSAEEVEIYLTDGQVVRTATFAAPHELGRIRFYAIELTGSLPGSSGEPPSRPIRKLVGLDRDGQVVACLVDSVQPGGTPLSACD